MCRATINDLLKEFNIVVSETIGSVRDDCISAEFLRIIDNSSIPKELRCLWRIKPNFNAVMDACKQYAAEDGEKKYLQPYLHEYAEFICDNNILGLHCLQKSEKITTFVNYMLGLDRQRQEIVSKYMLEELKLRKIASSSTTLSDVIQFVDKVRNWLDEKDRILNLLDAVYYRRDLDDWKDRLVNFKPTS